MDENLDFVGASRYWHGDYRTRHSGVHDPDSIECSVTLRLY